MADWAYFFFLVYPRSRQCGLGEEKLMAVAAYMIQLGPGDMPTGATQTQNGTEVGPMSVSKKYLKTRPIGKVTFRLSHEAAADVDQACLVGEFNGWSPTATRMQKLKSGDFKVTLDLEVGREYQFRYLLDQTTWTNDDSADRYVSSGVHGTENGVVNV